jgi:hypothetical protein
MTDELFLWKKNEDKWYEFLLWVELSFYLRVHVKDVKAIFTCFTINLKINLKETSFISQFLFEIFFFLNVVNSARWMSLKSHQSFLIDSAALSS